MNVRIFKTYMPDNFSSDIAQVPWQAFYFSSDIDDKVCFEEMFTPNCLYGLLVLECLSRENTFL